MSTVPDEEPTLPPAGEPTLTPEESPPATPKRKALGLGTVLLLLAGYFLLRAAILHTNFDAVSIPAYEQNLMGHTAKIGADAVRETGTWWEGWRGAPLHQFYDNCGGHIAVGFLGSLMFLAFGDTYLSLKLVPLLLGAIMLVIFARLLTRLEGRRAGWIAGLLFVIGPPTLTKYSLLAKGNHFEGLFLQVVLLWFFYRLHRRGVTPFGVFLLGLIAGLATSTYFGALLIIALVGLTHLFARGPRAFLRDLVPGGVGVLLGLIPVFYLQSRSGRPGGFFAHNAPKESHRSLATMLERGQEMFTSLLPRASCFEDLGSIPGEWAEWLWLVLFGCAWVVLTAITLGGLGRSRRLASDQRLTATGLKWLPLVGYLPLVVLAYSLSEFKFKTYAPPIEIGGFRYLVGHFFYGTLLIGVVVAKGWSSASRLVRFGGLGMGLGVLATGLFVLPIISTNQTYWGAGAKYPGYEWPTYASMVMRDSRVDDETLLRTWDHPLTVGYLAEFDVDQRRGQYRGVGYLLGMSRIMGTKRRRTRGDWPVRFDVGSALQPFPEEHRSDVAFGLGMALRTLLCPSAVDPAGFERSIQELMQEGHPLAPQVIAGLATNFNFLLAHRTAGDLACGMGMVKRLPENWKTCYARGVGQVAGRLLLRGIASDRVAVDQVLGSLPPQLAQEAWVGVGLSLAEDARTQDGERVLELRFELESVASREALCAGFGAGLSISSAALRGPSVYARLAPDLEAGEKQALERGLRWQASPPWFGG